jgi:TetR/AcrR family transcriptional regulator
MNAKIRIFDAISSRVEMPQKPTPLELKSAQKEDAIVAAAHKRFSYYGYTKTTMDEIAHDLGMGKASLYYYFPTKESLFGAVIVAEQNEFRHHAAALIAGPGTATEKIVQYVERRLDYFQKTMILSKFSTQAYSEIKPLFNDIREQFARRELQFLRQILEEGRESGEFTFDNSRPVARVLLHVLQGLRIRMFKSESGENPQQKEFERLRQETRIATQIFLRGLQPEPGGSTGPTKEGKPH